MVLFLSHSTCEDDDDEFGTIFGIVAIDVCAWLVDLIEHEDVDANDIDTDEEHNEDEDGKDFFNCFSSIIKHCA